jgi:hypothetical protein
MVKFILEHGGELPKRTRDRSQMSKAFLKGATEEVSLYLLELQLLRGSLA